ncbi:MAG: molybdopterin-dependent oxidoreductase [Candidatus Binatia bacterium]
MTRAGTQTTRTTCAYCGVGCGVVAANAGATTAAGEGGFAISGDPAHPAGAGRLCSKGSALADTLGMQGRLLRPRVNGLDTTWHEAIETVASRFRSTIAEHGPDSVAFYVSGQLLTEDYYVANKLMKGFLGSANIDTNSRLCMSSSVVAHQRAFGEDVVPGCYEDLEAADLVVLVGSNTAWCHPVLWRRIEEARRCRPSMQLVVLDPRRTPTAEAADLHLALRSGSDVHLFNGLLCHLDGEGHRDKDFVANHTSGAAEALAAARQGRTGIGEVALACGLDAALVERFFRLFATTERVVTAFSQGVNQSSSGSDKASSILNCHLLTGRIGKPGAGPFSITGQPNAMGGREVGGMANMLAAHLSLEDADHRRVVQEFWQSPRIAARPGLKAVDLFEAVGDGRIRALWIMATNPAVSLPDADRVRDAISRCPFVVVSDCVAATDTTSLAHVLLPAAAWGEKDGTTTNSERCIARQRAFVDPPGQARPDWWILSKVAAAMGYAEAFAYESAHDIFDEHARLSAAANHGTRAFDIGGLAGMTAAEYEGLEPIRWPVPERGHAGTQRMFGDGVFPTDDGRARLVATLPRLPRHAVDEAFPFVLNSGRIRDQWHTMTRTGVSARLSGHLPEPFVDLHAGDAAVAGITEGDLVKIASRWGSAVLKARISGEVAAGNLFVPIHWSAVNSSEGRIGAVVNPVVDPASGEPEFKHTPASIERVTLRWWGLLAGRGEVAAPRGCWWTRVQGQGHQRMEMAGTEAAGSEWARTVLGKGPGSEEFLEYIDDGAGIYRGARIAGGRLEAAVFLSARGVLPPRGWLESLFAKAALADTDRMALLAGAPLDRVEDASPLVCSCFSVRRAAITGAIQKEGLTTTAGIGACLKAGTNCGSCLPELRSLIAAAAIRPIVAEATVLKAAAPDRHDAAA